MTEKRNAFGFPQEDNLYAPLRDEPMLIEMYDDTPLLPGWALWIGVVFMAGMFALALVARLSTASYLRSKEWSMGNGQCPECFGVPASWHGHPLFLTADTIGHEAGCTLAAALRDAGETPLMIGGLSIDIEYEVCWPSGFLATQPKT